MRKVMGRSTSESILFAGSVDEGDVDGCSTPPFFRDLNLDQVLKALTDGREEYNLGPFFCYPLDDLESIAYRHDVFRDLEGDEIRGQVESFSSSMRDVYRHLVQADKLHEEYQKMSWFLDGVGIYCDAVETLNDGLSRADCRSEGFRRFRDYLMAYVRSEEFGSLSSETKNLKERLSKIMYRIRIRGLQVIVEKYGGEPDYSDEVEKTFRKFQEEAGSEYSAKGHPRYDNPDMNSVEARILDLVARLWPDVFGDLTSYHSRHAEFLDRTVRRFDREVQFYLAYLGLVRKLKSAGLEFCYPGVSGESKSVRAAETFDLALAIKLVGEGGKVVPNDLYLEGPERVLVVSGPNQGGKTTFARTFGQLHHLARLGCPAPGREAELFLSDQIYTHFEREERVESLRGKLQDELIRMHDVLGQATDRSIVIVNEGFTSTTLSDALFIGREVLRRIIDLDCLCVYVTFIDELSTLGESTVSMVGTVVPENPSQRTYKVVRKPADGRAYAMAIAEKYGLTRRSIRRRLAR